MILLRGINRPSLLGCCRSVDKNVVHTRTKHRVQRGLVPGLKHPEQLWQPVIGLEIHAQLNAAHKLFSPDTPFHSFNAPPNTLVSYFDAALPGTLPQLNQACVDLAVQAAMALNCQIPRQSRFDRKHYFYHDLPAGYQITQKFEPLAKNGQVALGDFEGLPYNTFVRIEQVQLEQDTAKTGDVKEGVMDPFLLTGAAELIDMNRVGAPLVEIVTRPDLRSATEALAFIKHLQLLLRHLGLSTGNMDEGHFRVDVNVSVRQSTQRSLGVRTELKNLSGLRVIQEAIEFEVKRHISLYEAGQSPVQATRGYDNLRGETVHLRAKESEKDYRYFPDPDLPPLQLSLERLDRLRASLPERPSSLFIRFQRDYGLKAEQVRILLDQAGLPAYFEAIVHQPIFVSGKKTLCERRDGKVVANWLLNTIFGILASRRKSLFHLESGKPLLSPEQVASVMDAVAEGKMVTHQGKAVLEHWIDSSSQQQHRKELAFDFIQQSSSTTATTTHLNREQRTLHEDEKNNNVETFCISFASMDVLKGHIRELVSQNPKGLRQLGGTLESEQPTSPGPKLKPTVLTWFAGHTMKRVHGQADPDTIKEALRQVMVGEFRIPEAVFTEWASKHKSKTNS